jgi:hypothetical protein
LINVSILHLLGSIHWSPKCQTITAGSSTVAEMYAIDECVRFLLDLSQILEFLVVKDVFLMPTTNNIYNDNQVCIQWSKHSPTKGLHHIQVWEDHVRENVVSHFVTLHNMLMGK